jgi:hypothetical protein
MKLLIASMSCLAIGVAAANPVAAQGPVRQGLRRTGEIAAQGTRRVAEGAGAVVRGAGQAAVDVTRGAGQAAAGVAQGAANAGRAVVGGTARGVAAGVNAITPGIPWQAGAGANLQARDLDRNARWRFQQRGGDWWYYSPQNTWMYQRDGQWNQFSQDTFVPNPAFDGEHAVGYRGMPTGQQGGVESNQALSSGAAGYASGPAYRLYVDPNGREYICDQGQRVYINAGQGAEGGQQYETGYRGANEGPMTPTPAIPTNEGADAATTSAQDQGEAPPATDGQAPAANPTTQAPSPTDPTAPASSTQGTAAPAAAAPATAAPATAAPTSGAAQQ